MCGCRDLGEALRRIGEGAAMIRTKGEAGTGNIVEAVRHMRAVHARDPHARRTLREDELMAEAKTLGAPLRAGAAGGAHRQAAGAQLRRRRRRDARRRRAHDAARRRGGVRGLGHLRGRARRGCPKSARDPAAGRRGAIVQAVANYNRPEILAQVSEGLPKCR